MSDKELVIPSDLSYLSNLIDGNDSTLKNILEGAGGQPYIKASNGEFTLVLGRDNTENLGDTLTCVIVGVNMKCRGFYKESYVPGSSSPPDCCSCNGITPDKVIDNPESKTCANCSQAVRGSGKAFTPGALVSACVVQPKIILIPSHDLASKENKLYSLHVKRGSIVNLQGFAKRLAEMNVPSTAFVTVKLGFQSVGQNKQLTFTIINVLDQKTAIKMSEVTKSPRVKDLLFAENQFKTDDVEAEKQTPVKKVKKEISKTEIEQDIGGDFEDELENIMDDLDE